jgi:hypothetical protein
MNKVFLLVLCLAMSSCYSVEVVSEPDADQPLIFQDAADDCHCPPTAIINGVVGGNCGETVVCSSTHIVYWCSLDGGWVIEPRSCGNAMKSKEDTDDLMCNLPKLR